MLKQSLTIHQQADSVNVPMLLLYFHNETILNHTCIRCLLGLLKCITSSAFRDDPSCISKGKSSAPLCICTIPASTVSSTTYQTLFNRSSSQVEGQLQILMFSILKKDGKSECLCLTFLSWCFPCLTSLYRVMIASYFQLDIAL